MYTKLVQQKRQDFKEKELRSIKSNNESRENSPEALPHSNSM